MSRHFANGPEFQIAPGKKVGDNHPTFIIGELNFILIIGCPVSEFVSPHESDKTTCLDIEH